MSSYVYSMIPDLNFFECWNIGLPLDVKEPEILGLARNGESKRGICERQISEYCQL